MRMFYRCLTILAPVFILFQLKSSGQTAAVSNSAYHPSSIFLENKGQCLSLESKKPLNDILFKVSSAKGDLYITTRGLSYVFYRTRDSEDKTGPQGLQAPSQRQAAKALEKIHYEIERVDINLDNSSINRENSEIIYKPGIAKYNYYRKDNKVENIRMIEKLIIHNIYPDIDWVLYMDSTAGRAMLKQDFVLRPGADSRNIIFRYSGNAKIGVDKAGAITVKSKMGTVTEVQPYVFESGTKHVISVTVTKVKNSISYTFVKPIIQTETIIDPDLFWGTALTSDVTGINYNDEVFGSDVRTDSAGNIYVLLTTTKGVSFPTLNMGNGAYYKDFTSTPLGAMDIMKFNKGGVLLWSTFFGDQTIGVSLALDPFNNLYVDGIGSATDNIPLTDNGGYFDATSNYNFLTKFSPGGQLLWCTYWGTFEMVVSQLVCDSKGNLYVNGVSNSVNFPLKNPGGGAYFQIYGQNSFISEFSPTDQLLWSTLITGMAYYNSRERMAIDPSDNVYVMGDSVRMFNLNHQETWSDATVGWPYLTDITADRQGNVFVVGFGPGWIVKTDPGNGAFIDNTPTSGNSTGFIIKYNSTHQIVWSTPFFNQTMTDIYRIVADQKCDAVHVVGVMNSGIDGVPTMDNSCNGDFYFSPAQTVTTYAPIFLTFKTSGRLVYTSLSNFPYNYYERGLAVATDPFGGIVYLFGQIFNFSNIPAVKDPGGGAFVQSGSNNLSLSAFLMKLTPSKMNATLSMVAPAGCSCNGSASVNVLCGTAPYTYLWSTGATTPALSGLCSGKYSVTVTDDNCNDTTFAFVIPPAPGSITGFDRSSLNAHCNRNDGEIDIPAVQGGTGPYQYSINNQLPQNNGTFPGLLPGLYLITVADVNGCAYKDSVAVINSPGPDSIYSKSNAASCKLADGSIIIEGVDNGTLPYQYSLNAGPFSTVNLFSGLFPGNYFIQAEDANGCTYGDSVRVIQSLPPGSSAIDVFSSHCYLQDGSLNITSVSGGNAPYTYSLDGTTYQSSVQFGPLQHGKYGIHIMDSKNCVLVDSVQILDISGPTKESITVANAVCNSPFGSITINSVTGGTRPFAYSMDSLNFQSLGTFNSLIPGAYKLYIRDSAGCTLSDNFIITSSVSTPVKISPADTTVCYGEAILFSVTPDIGPTLKTFNWNNGLGQSETFETIINDQGLINISVTNDSNCTSTASVQVNVKNCDSVADVCVHFPNAFTPDGDGKNDGFGALAHCPVTRYKLNIYNRYGQIVFTSNDLAKRWDGTMNGVPQVVGNYVYICDYSIGPVNRIKKGFVVLIR
jgi:gliding motility-associated-like protein